MDSPPADGKQFFGAMDFAGVTLVQVHGIVALKANEPSGRLDGWNSAELLRGTTAAIGSFCYT